MDLEKNTLSSPTDNCYFHQLSRCFAIFCRCLDMDRHHHQVLSQELRVAKVTPETRALLQPSKRLARRDHPGDLLFAMSFN